ncbi:MAG: YcgN family cysteine cluster protein [Desulfatiglandales bacterium]
MTLENQPFWKIKALEEMIPEEWESLDTTTCRCLVYSDRTLVSGDCVVLNPKTLREINRLPKTCAYRLLAEGKDLPDWHPLVSGRPKTVHEAGISVRDCVVPGRYVHPDDLLRKAGRKKRAKKKRKE